MSHTPGPWTVECDESGVFVLMGPLKGEDEYLAVYAAPIDGEASSRRVADARLIAAAPDLLAAADAALALMDEGGLASGAFSDARLALYRAISAARGVEVEV